MGMQVERQSWDHITNVVNEFCKDKEFEERLKQGDDFTREDVLQEINDNIKSGEEVPRAIFQVLNDEGFFDEHQDGTDDLEDEFVDWYDEAHG